MLRTRADVILTMAALTLPKIAEEYFVHVATRPWQAITLLPESISTPDREYWVWVPIMLALPAVAMARLLLRDRQPTAQQKLRRPQPRPARAIPIGAAILGRQSPRPPPATHPLPGDAF